jgi:O-antigen/teichoic acid export membrane protein
MAFLRAYEKMERTVAGLFGGDTLKAKTFRGGAWLGSGSFLEQASRFGRNILLTRMLAPEAFGTMVLVTSATSALGSLLDVGAREALIQNPKGHEESHVGATWWITFGRSLSLYFFLFLLAPLAARAYGNSELTTLFRVSGIGLLFEGVISPRAYAAIKQLNLRKWAAINHGGGIAGVVITVILSFFIRDVWALVLGFIAENAARCLLSYLLSPFLPPLRWDRTAMRELLKFSRGLYGLSPLSIIYMRTDIFVLAKLFSPAALGLYVMAVTSIQTPTGFLINIMGQTMFPTFTHIQDDKPRMNRILLQVTAAVFFLGLPILVFLFFCGHFLLTVAYGYRYGAAAGALFLAGCAALLNVANGPITSIIYARGFPQLHRRCVAIMAILMILLIYPFAKWFGLAGGQLACVISMAGGYLSQVERIRKVTGLELSRYKKSIVVSGAISLSVFGACLAARAVMSLRQPVLSALIGVVGCAVAYGVAYAVLFGGARNRTESVLGL